MRTSPKRNFTKLALLATLLLLALAATPALAQWMGGGMGYGMGNGRGCWRGRGPVQSVAPTNLPDAGSAGAQAFAATCARCHGLPDPTAYGAGQWPGIVERMEGYMQSRGIFLSAKELNAIVGYLEKNARQQ